jgi:peptidoglycan/LPS O-acetylase OafA/YrhL
VGDAARVVRAGPDGYLTPRDPRRPDRVSDPSHLTLARIRALDGLRGVAVIAVLLFHDQRLRGGYLGVDLFFVLSGFLITSLLLADHERHGRVGLRHFYARRARRLLPALGIALAGVALYAAVWARPGELPRIRWDGIATLFYFQNWREILTQQNYWDAFTAPSPLQHAWSLSIEEQFYAFWPLLLIGVLAVRRSARAVLTVTLTLAAAGATYTLVSAHHGGDARFLYYSTLTRAPALLLGAALAALYAVRGPVASRGGRIALEVGALAAIAYLAYAWSHQIGDGLSLYRGPLLLCGLAAVVVIAAAAHPSQGPIARVLAAPPLVGVGLISYGLYLFHWPVYLVLTPARTGRTGWTLFAERVTVSVLIAVASYLLVELPIRHGALRPARAFAVLGTATAVVAASLVLTTHVTPIPIPTPASIASVEPAAAAGPGPSGATGTTRVRRSLAVLARSWPRPTAPLVPEPDVRTFLPPGDWSRLTNTCDVNHPAPPAHAVRHTPAPKVLMLGDSVGCFIGASLDMNQVRDGVVTLNRARLGCPLVSPRAAQSTDGVPVTVYPACIDGQQSTIDAFRPDLALLMVGGADVDEADLGDGEWVKACEPRFDAWYEAGARRTIAALGATGASVVVVTVVHPPKIINIGVGVAVPAEYGRDVECENRALRRAVSQEPRAHLLDLDAYVCPDGKCIDRMDGVVLRVDGRHFQGPAANYISPWILDHALALAHIKPFR